jgi:hypothetical protein
MKKNYIVIFCFIIAIIFSIYFYMSKSNNIVEGIWSSRQLTVAAILNDRSISPHNKINMIKLINIGDQRYANIINDPNMNNNDKISALRKIYT